MQEAEYYVSRGLLMPGMLDSDSCQQMLKRDMRCGPPYSATGSSFFRSNGRSQERRKLRALVCAQCRARSRYDKRYIKNLQTILDFIDSSKGLDSKDLQERVVNGLETASKLAASSARRPASPGLLYDSGDYTVLSRALRAGSRKRPIIRSLGKQKHASKRRLVMRRTRKR